MRFTNLNTLCYNEGIFFIYQKNYKGWKKNDKI